jgi:ATP-dependent protease Clp ATPase subunit
LRCAFCQKSQDAVAKLISSPSDYPRTYICDECVAVCNSILEDDRRESGHPATAASDPNCSKTIQREEIGDDSGDGCKNQPRDEAALGREEEDRGREKG